MIVLTIYVCRYLRPYNVHNLFLYVIMLLNQISQLFQTKIYEILLVRCKELLCASKTQEKDKNTSSRTDIEDIGQFFNKVIDITLHI